MSDACCYVDIDEYAKVYRSAWRKAAKEHQCDECLRVIAKGERYDYVTMFYEWWQTFRTCAFCKALVRDYCGGQHLHGGLHELLWDCLDYDLINDEFRDEDD